MCPTSQDEFAAGFICGQAEKVFLGSCRAAMFRVSDDRRDKMLGVMYWMMEIYYLKLTEIPGELWLCRDSETIEQVRRLTDMIIDSPQWHLHRAWLVGIPTNEVDVKYHELPGHGKRCD